MVVGLCGFLLIVLVLFVFSFFSDVDRYYNSCIFVSKIFILLENVIFVELLNYNILI